MIHFHPSSLGNIMTDAQSVAPHLITEELAEIIAKRKRTDEETALLQAAKERSLSAGAKTYCCQLAKEFVYNFRSDIRSKYLDKGIIVEDQSIQLYNEVFFTSLSKNTERRTNEWLTGECDIFTGKKIIDIKSAWSLATFPATKAEAHDNDYEWQGRGYMMLWDCDQFELAYCMVSTPEELIGFDDTRLHYVDHIAPELRVTRVLYDRDMTLEEKIKVKAEAARAYINEIIDTIAKDHAA